ncbi:MAG: hypothetical protein JRN44_01960 [Nitrososphaerota archaeon]|nr:hypothetical protein [Nitrososphaerota archaeon]MDG6947270.1 hypothetical protein [Nitrososphaerota archaeon]
MSTVASAHLAAARDPRAMVESPPSGIPPGFFRFEGTIRQDGIKPGGGGLGIEPLNKAPQSGEPKALVSHED